VDLDNPAEAARHVEGIEDPSLRKYVPGAARPFAEAPEAACLELAEWYRALGDGAPAGAKAAMYARAEAYLERFLDVHSFDDLDRTRAAALLEKVDAALDKAQAAQWIDLMPLVDPKKHAVRGQWERQGTGMAIVRWTDFGRLMIPAVLHGGYDMRVCFTRTSGQGIVGIIVPAGPAGIQLIMGYQNCYGLGELGGRDAASNQTTVRPCKIENNRTYDVRIKVRLEGKEAAIRVAIDGKDIIRWRGPLSALSPRAAYKQPNAACVGIGVLWTHAAFKNARLRMLTGQARLIR
jgi:hypothetical protein